MHLHTEQPKPKDRDFIRTREGMFFCVTGYLHPPDRYTAFLKYSPDPLGKWRQGEMGYRREIPYYHVENVAETIRYLEANFPWYVHDCPVRGIRFSMVPHEYVAHYYNPAERLQAVVVRPQDPLEAEAGALAQEIAARANVSLDSIGLTGSILLELHNPELSDINLMVYGLENSQKVRAVLRDAANRDQLQPLNEAITERWTREMTEWFPLTADEARYSVSRRWNYGLFNGRFFGIHPTRTDSEITEKYGAHRYRGTGAACIQARVTDATESIFQPAIYRVSDSRVLAGSPGAASVTEIISYEGRYRDSVEAGQWLEARGKLETVDGVPRQLVIGTTKLSGDEYLKPVKPL
jgi:predicted nucleotidyltransferase